MSFAIVAAALHKLADAVAGPAVAEVHALADQLISLTPGGAAVVPLVDEAYNYLTTTAAPTAIPTLQQNYDRGYAEGYAAGQRDAAAKATAIAEAPNEIPEPAAAVPPTPAAQAPADVVSPAAEVAPAPPETGATNPLFTPTIPTT